MSVDPWGVVLAQAPDTEPHIGADRDLKHVKKIRKQIPALGHRREMKVHA